MKNDKWVYFIGGVSALLLFVLAIYTAYQIGCNKRNYADELIYKLGWKCGVVAGIKAERDYTTEGSAKLYLDVTWISDSIEFVELITFDE